MSQVLRLRDSSIELELVEQNDDYFNLIHLEKNNGI